MAIDGRGECGWNDDGWLMGAGLLLGGVFCGGDCGILTNFNQSFRAVNRMRNMHKMKNESASFVSCSSFSSIFLSFLVLGLVTGKVTVVLGIAFGSPCLRAVMPDDL